MGNGRTEGLPAKGVGGQAEISLMPDVKGTVSDVLLDFCNSFNRTFSFTQRTCQYKTTQLLLLILFKTVISPSAFLGYMIAKQSSPSSPPNPTDEYYSN